MTASQESRNVIEKYLPVYIILLIIPVLEVMLAYQHFSPGMLLGLLLALALCSATLALRYFMHLAQETRGLFWALIPAAIFVLLMMNMSWSDSLRLLHMRPFAH